MFSLKGRFFKESAKEYLYENFSGSSSIALFIAVSARAFEFISLADTSRVTIFGEDVSEGRIGAQDGCKETIN
jgi:hypothetical protein